MSILLVPAHWRILLGWKKAVSCFLHCRTRGYLEIIAMELMTGEVYCWISTLAPLFQRAFLESLSRLSLSTRRLAFYPLLSSQHHDKGDSEFAGRLPAVLTPRTFYTKGHYSTLYLRRYNRASPYYGDLHLCHTYILYQRSDLRTSTLQELHCTLPVSTA